LSSYSRVENQDPGDLISDRKSMSTFKKVVEQDDSISFGSGEDGNTPLYNTLYTL